MNKLFIRYDGHITNIDEVRGTFIAHLIEIRKPNNELSTISYEFDIEFLSNAIRDIDKKWFKEGAYIQYYIRYHDEGYENADYGILKFIKRYWKKEELEEAQIRAEELSYIFNFKG